MEQFAEIQKFMDDNMKWSNETFIPNSTVLSCLHHLKKEVSETIEEVEFADGVGGEAAPLMEFADMYILLLESAARKGFTFTQLHTAGVNKMIINRKRTWGKPNEQGFTEHVK